MNSEILYLQDQLSLLPEARRQLLIDTFGNRWQAGFALAGNTSGGASLALFTPLNRHGLLQDIERCQALFALPPSSCCRSKSAPGCRRHGAHGPGGAGGGVWRGQLLRTI